MGSFTIRVVGLLALSAMLTLGGCGTGGSSTDAGSRACYAPLDANAGVVCPVGDAGPCNVEIACDDDLWKPDPLPNRPWWLRHPPAACEDEVAHGSCEVPEALDDCPPIPTNFSPSSCSIPDARAATCANSGYWTQTCHTSADCPHGMGCVDANDSTDAGPIHDSDSIPYGLCRQRCGAAGDPECVRCDTVCGAEGYCEPRPPPCPIPPSGDGLPDCRPHGYLSPCEYDCDCLPEFLCGEGRCLLLGIPYAPGCETPDAGGGGVLGCPCNVGSCEINTETRRGCCRAPDGHIAVINSDPVCR